MIFLVLMLLPQAGSKDLEGPTKTMLGVVLDLTLHQQVLSKPLMLGAMSP